MKKLEEKIWEEAKKIAEELKLRHPVKAILFRTEEDGIIKTSEEKYYCLACKELLWIGLDLSAAKRFLFCSKCKKKLSKIQ